MTEEARTRPYQIAPFGSGGTTVDDGTYALEVNDGEGEKWVPAAIPRGGDEAEGLAKLSSADYDIAYITGSVPTVLLPAGSVPADMATYAPNAPYGTIIKFKA